jgi:hypothetical protein
VASACWGEPGAGCLIQTKADRAATRCSICTASNRMAIGSDKRSSRYRSESAFQDSGAGTWRHAWSPLFSVGIAFRCPASRPSAERTISVCVAAPHARQLHDVSVRLLRAVLPAGATEIVALGYFSLDRCFVLVETGENKTKVIDGHDISIEIIPDRAVVGVDALRFFVPKAPSV